MTLLSRLTYVESRSYSDYTYLYRHVIGLTIRVRFLSLSLQSDNRAKGMNCYLDIMLHVSGLNSQWPYGIPLPSVSTSL